jgi:hypothetical protein
MERGRTDAIRRLHGQRHSCLVGHVEGIDVYDVGVTAEEVSGSFYDRRGICCPAMNRTLHHV